MVAAASAPAGFYTGRMEERSSGVLVRLGGMLSEPARARMLLALLGGERRPATELAQLSGVTPQTASAHLKLLTEGGALRVEAQGRHRYYRLASDAWGEALESMLALQQPLLTRPQPAPTPLARARLCYRHLAGHVGVAWADALQQRDYLGGSGADMQLTRAGHAALRKAGLLERDDEFERLAAKPCLDWTERRHHLAGPLANALTQRMLERRWLLPSRGSRVLLPTAEGESALRRLGAVLTR
jgi:DNA-binding transcriptional ArsR family regulator